MLDVGDPNESISVPMILTTENCSFKSLIRGKREVSQQVIIRKVTRDHYRRYYAKDVEGNYVGTEKPAVDVGLVLVPHGVKFNGFSKSHVNGRIAKIS